MAAQLIWDTLEGQAQYSFQIDLAKSMDRTAMIVGLDDSLTSQQLLFACETLLTTQHPLGSSHPEKPALVLRRYDIRPAGAKNAYVTAHYEAPANPADSQGGGVLFVYEERCSLAQIQTNILWDDAQPIQIKAAKYIAANAVPANPSGADLIAAGTNISILRPQRSIKLTGLVKGAIPYWLSYVAGKVNSDAWQGEGVAAWLIADLSVQRINNGAYHTVTAEFITAPGAPDWRQGAIQWDQISGRYIICKDSELADARAATYKYGLIYEGNGFSVFGPYQTIAFNDWF